MKIFSFLFGLICLSSSAFADNEFALLAGLRSSSAETNLSSASVKSKSSYQLGAVANLDIYQSLALRSGILLSGRQVSLGPTLSGQVDLNFVYVDVPFTALYRFSNLAGIFAGPVFSFNQSKEVSCTLNTNCAATNVKAVIFPIQLGLQFRFASQMGGELYYEYVAGDIADNISNMKTIGANFLIFFE